MAAHERTMLLKHIAHAACDWGDYDLALQVFQGIGKGGIKACVDQAFYFVLIVDRLATRENFARAAPVAKASALDDMATAHVDAGHDQEALKTAMCIQKLDACALGVGLGLGPDRPPVRQAPAKRCPELLVQ